MSQTFYDLEPKWFSEWLETRPKIVQELAKEFPWGNSHKFNNGVLFVVGWDDRNKIMMSEINPREGLEAKEYAEKNYILLDVELLRATKMTVQ